MEDAQVMLMALSKEREVLHEQLMQIDRIIKRVKTGEHLNNNESAITLQIEPRQAQRIAFPKHTDIKVVVLKAFDSLNKVASLKQVSEEYTKLSGNSYNIRDTVRGLHKAKLLWLMKEKDADRGIYWLKREWVENGNVLDEYKPEGFDLLYKADNLLFV